MPASVSLDPLRQTLTTLASQVVVAMPDLYQMAHDGAAELLQSLGIKDDPDSLYWHRFDNAQSSHKSYSGFAHQGPPEESMTFTQLFMCRFRVSDQDNADVLNAMGGFYRAGPETRWFNELNDVRLLPAQVLDHLWRLDFSATYHQQIDAFWTLHTASIETLARINCLTAAVESCQHGELSRQQVQWVAEELGIAQMMSLTLADLTGHCAPLPESTPAMLQIGGYDLVTSLCFTVPGGQRLLYLAGRTSAFQAFADCHAFHRWLHEQLADEDLCSHLLVHGGLLNETEAHDRQRAWRHLADKAPDALASQVTLRGDIKDAGAWLCLQSREQMLIEANLRLHSNSDLRKQLWIGYLSAGSRMFGPAAMVAWPVALLAVAASATKLALQIDQAVHAADATSRKAAILGAVMTSIELLLNATLLLPGAIPEVGELEPLQANPDIPPTRPALPEADGVLIIAGERHIRMGGKLYRVRFDRDLQCWLLIDPQRPFAFTGNYPVRFNEQLEWEAIDGACLRGGGQCLGIRPAETAPPIDYAQFTTPAGHYEVPKSAREATRELLGANFRRLLSGEYYNPNSPLNPVLDSLDRLRGQVITDATQFIQQWRPGPRSPVPVPDAQVPPALAFRRLLADSRGVVIGESHQAVSSKKFLIDNMRALANDGVDTLYMEHLMSDLHQAELDLVPRSGKLKGSLQDYLRDMDVGHQMRPLGEYTFTELVRSARRAGIRVRALDCAASYRLDGMSDLYEVGGTLRQQVFSYYANKVISAGEAGRRQGKWIAFVGDTHASSYKRVPGLAQLQDVPAVRIVDAGAGQETPMTLDPGEYYLPSLGRPDGVVKADWRLAIRVRDEPFEFRDPSLAPPGVSRP